MTRESELDDDPEPLQNTNFSMVIFSPDSSDEDSLNLIKAKLRKRERKFEEDIKEDDDSSSAGVGIMDANIDKENAESDSSEEEIQEKKKLMESKDDWDDDSISDEALETAMLKAKSIHAKWLEKATNENSNVSVLPQRNPLPRPTSYSSACRETGVPSTKPVVQTHIQHKNPQQRSIAHQHSDESESLSSNDSSSSSDGSKETNSAHIPPRIVVLAQQAPIKSASPTTSPHFQASSKDSDSWQDITPYASPEKPVMVQGQTVPQNQSTESSSVVIPKKKSNEPCANEVATKVESRVPVDNPFCVCEYASEDEWSFSELENKDKPPAPKDDLDAFGLAISESAPMTLEIPSANGNGEGTSSTSNAEGAPCAATEEDKSSDRVSEIDPSFYVPKPPVVFEKPIVHEFNLRTRPPNRRSTVSVHSVFQSPITRLWYSKFDSFNQMQSEMSNMLANSDDNVVVSAPTGAGKTAVFEMAMARFFSADLEISGTNRISKKRKIVYISPSKALCEERYDDWSRRLQGMNLNIQLAVITGDGDPAESFHDLASSQFILTTPEKWDSLTRRWTEKFFLFASVKLFLIDEVHLIADGSRGCCLEATIMRMKTIQKAAQNVSVSQAELASSSYASTSPEAINSVFRMVAVSATLPNIADIAMFLEANEAHVFDGSYRPVPLTTHVVSTGRIGKNEFLFAKNLCESVPNTVLRFSDQRPTIVFCHSKNDTEKLADLLARSHQIGSNVSGMSNIASQTRLRKLQMAMMRGMAYHHAGLDVSDRRLVEKAFLEGKIKVLCATSTLAMGVNLPAHLVVVMGTRAWRGKAGYQDLEQASLLQMIGRAGRPGFDTSGTAVILTDLDSKHKFETMATRGLPSAMSQCVGEKLVETLNTEIAQRVVTSVETASNWFMNTLSFIQETKNAQSAEDVEARITVHCSAALEQLKAIGVVALSPAQEVFPLAACHVMSSNLVGLDAFKAITSIPHDASLCQMLKSLSSIEDLQRPLRKNEKKPLNAAQKMVKYHLEGTPSQVRVKENWEKVFVLLQVHISQLQMDCNNPTLDFTLRSETVSMVDFASRMLAAIEEYSHKGSENGHVVFQSLRLRRSLALQLWGPQDGVLGQIQGVSKEAVGKLRMNGITSFDDVVAKTATQLESAASQEPPFGSNLQAACKSLLESALQVEAKISTTQGLLTPNDILCTLKPRLTPAPSNRSSKAVDLKYSLIVYTDQPGGCLFYKDNISESGEHRIFAPPKYGKISVRLVASICGLDDVVEIEGNMPEASSKAALSSSMDEGKNLCSRIRCPGVKRKVLTQTTLEKKQRTSKGANSRQSTCRATTVLRDRIQNTESAGPRSKTTQKTKSAIASTISPSPKSHSSVPISCSVLGDVTSTEDQGVLKDASHSESRDRPIHLSQQSIQMMNNDSSIRNHGRSYDFGPLKSPYTGRITGASSPFLPVHSSGWKKARSLQQKQQQRAFVRKKDNPFTLYSHDPNNSESFLEELSTKNRSQDTRSILPPKQTRNNISSEHPKISWRPSWNKSIAAHGRQKRTFRGSLLDHATSSSFSELREQHPPQRSFGNADDYGFSKRTPNVATPPPPYDARNDHLSAFPSHLRGNRHSPVLSRHDGQVFQIRSRQSEFDNAYDQFEPPQRHRLTDCQYRGLHKLSQERSPIFHREQRSHASSQYQTPYAPHDSYHDLMSGRDPVYYDTPACYRQPYRVTDPHCDDKYEVMMEGHQLPYQQSAAHYEDVEGHHCGTGTSHCQFPVSRGHNNFHTQEQPMLTSTHGVNDDDLASAFL